MQLAFEWTRREWSLVVSSSGLEGILHRRKEECINQIVEERENRPSGEWMQSKFVVGRRKGSASASSALKVQKQRPDFHFGAGQGQMQALVWKRKDQMDIIIERISDADTNHLDDAYQYPEWKVGRS